MFKTPVLLLVFNRPKQTAIVLEKIRQIKPRELFIAADGPRPYQPDDIFNCTETRKLVIESVDWECEVKTLFQDKNQGCGLGVSNAISWFFSHVEEGIILEDDCVPSVGFFIFCEELLHRYRSDLRIMQVSGANFFPRVESHCSYFFSKYGLIWGWATWRRAWEKYDFNLSLFRELKDTQQIQLYYREHIELMTRIKQFDLVYRKQMDTWDYQWSLAKLAHHGLSIIPSVNLISNIGFGESSTHTKIKNGLQEMEIDAINFPLKHPSYILHNYEFDSGIESQAKKRETFYNRIRHLVSVIKKRIL